MLTARVEQLGVDADRGGDVELQGIAAMIAGGSGGLGFATASEFVRAGARVVVLDLPSGAGEPAVAALGQSAAFVGGDVTSPEDVGSALDVAEGLGTLRVVVNCAGVATPGRVVGRNGPLPLEDFERVVRINLVGTFNVLRLAAACISQTVPVSGERGVIINTASAAAFEGQVGQAAYASSKGGVASLTLPAARELAAAQIRVMAVAPGLFRTPMLAGLPQEAQDSLARQVPHPSRLGAPAEYAALVRHIVENPMLNGEVIRLDGAIRMAPR
jgi:NAD(P)-dependent dehydrogenase (short-subunit alcohol dehydrogenase family)